MILDNGLLTLEFDDATGSLVGLTDRDGYRHLTAPEDGRLFRVVVPDDTVWIDRYADSHECGRPEMRRERDTLVLHYPTLRSAIGETLAIAVTVRVRLPEGADEAAFIITVENGCPWMIHEVWYPRVGGWRGYAGPGQDTFLRGDLNTSDPHNHRKTAKQNGYTLANAHKREYLTFAFGMVFPFLDLSGADRGLSYIHYPTAPHAGGLVIEDLNERRGDCHTAWSWVHQPYLAPGATWTSEPVGLATHDGDWHATADRLRAWLGTWWTPPRTPPELKTRIGYFNLYARDFMGREWTKLADVPAIAQELLDHGIQDFCLWDMSMATYLRAGTGDFLEDTPERMTEIGRALAAVRALGMQVSTLVNYRLTTAKNRSWPLRAEAQAMRTYHGAIRYENWSTCRGNFATFLNSHLDEGGGSLCQNHPGFQQWALDLTDDLLDFGFNSLFVDQPFETSVCFASDHDHPVPGYGHAGANEWVPQATAKVHARDAGGYTIGENTDIFTSQSIDLWWDWHWASKRADVFRYILPESLQSWILDAYEHQHEIGKAFALGFLLSLNVRGLELPLTTEPAFAARIKRLAALRARTAAFTVCGRFADQRGLTVESPCPIAAYVYDAGDALGIILGEHTDGTDGGGEVILTLDMKRYSKHANTVRLHREDGSVTELQPKTLDTVITLRFPLARWECAVVEVG
jgi:hypothetical protein